MPKPQFAPITSTVVRVKGGAVPAADAAPLHATQQGRAAGLVSISFKMPREFVEDFKDTARADRIKLNELLVAALSAYKAAQR